MIRFASAELLVAILRQISSSDENVFPSLRHFIKMISSTNFNLSEEAFILSSLKEVVHVWARGNGQATFNLSIVDGFADLQLGFRLGSPTDLHLLPEQVHPLPQEPPRGHLKRKKSTAKLAKDKARAAEHQARIQSKVAAATSSSSAEEILLDVILPITGKIIPIKSASSSSTGAVSASPLTAPAPVSTAAPAATPSPCAPPPPRTPPTKSAASTPKRYFDVNCVKKHLFSAAPPNPTLKSFPPPLPPSSQAYKRQEDELWSRLFK